MRRTGGLWNGVASYEALRHAAIRAARGKRTTASAARFLDRLEPECLQLERELAAGSWRPSVASTFSIHDPKPRTITAIPFRDRVVHHALIGVLEPVFDRRMIAHSFACRRGRGLHAALARMRGLVRRRHFALRMDIASFFASLRHDVVFDSVARCVKDRRVLELVRRIVDGPMPDAHMGIGLPIGSLTSQWFANLVLDRLDHFACEQLRLRGWLRYMDDFGSLDDDRRRLRDAQNAIEGFLHDRLALRPKASATLLTPTSAGVPWLGFLVFPGVTRLRPQNARRSAWRLRELRWRLARGRVTEQRYRAAVASVLAHVAHADTRALQRGWFRDHTLEL